MTRAAGGTAGIRAARFVRARCAPPAPTERSAGVTLIELLIVLMLMGIIAAFVMPTFGGNVPPGQLKAAARELAAGLRLARSEAISRRAETTLELNVAARTFQVPPDPRVVQLSEHIDMKLYTAQRDLVSDQIGSVRFFPDGGSNGGRITVAAGERSYYVDIDWLTGRVTILE